MSGSNQTFFAGTTTKAFALGDHTATNTTATTAAWPGLAVGYAVAVAVAQDTAPTAPHTDATSDAIATGGYITSSHSGGLSVDYPYGPTPTSVDVSVTTTSSYGGGDALSAYGLSAPSLHGLF
jgi:hypothetical protein